MLSGADLGNFFRIMAIIVTEGPPIDSVPLTPLNEKCLPSPIYRVEKRILQVEFFLNIYSMLQDINLKIGTHNTQVLSYDYLKA